VKQKKPTNCRDLLIGGPGVKPVHGFKYISDTIERNLCIAIQTITALIDTLRRIRV